MVFWTVCRYEFARNLTFGRWWALSLVAVLLFCTSTLNFADYWRVVSEESGRARGEFAEVTSAMQSPAELVHADFRLFKAIEASAVINFGSEQQTPSGARFNLIDQAVAPFFPLARNIFQSRQQHIDWVFVVVYCLTLGALVLGHDAVSGERESGTLDLALSNSVSRAVLLAAKLGGLLASLTLPLLVGTGSGLLLLTLGGVPVSAADLLAVAGFVTATTLLLTVALLVACGVSILAPSSANALIWVVVLWVAFVVMLPAAARSAAELYERLPSEEYFTHRLSLAQGEVLAKPLPDPVSTTQRLDQARKDVRHLRRERVERQLRLARSIGVISPCFLYRAAVESLTDTGSARHGRFSRQAEEYLESLRDTVNRARFPDLRQVGAGAAARPPAFSERRPSLNGRFSAALPPLCLLALEALVIFLLVFFCFARLSL